MVVESGESSCTRIGYLCDISHRAMLVLRRRRAEVMWFRVEVPVRLTAARSEGPTQGPRTFMLMVEAVSSGC